MSEPLFVGVDGGGTRCRARVCNAAGERLGEGMAGSANIRLGFERTFEEVERACSEALRQAGIAAEALSRVHAGLGLAGLFRSERDAVLAYPHPFAGVVADTDGHVACLGAHGGADGAILVVGTGSGGYAVIAGEALSIGGCGFQLADQGSGAALGRDAVRRALWAFEGVVAGTSLTRAVMARFHDSTEEAVRWGDAAKPKDFAALAPLVFEHAAQGDALARELIGAAATELAQIIAALHRRGAPAVALVGGLARPIAPYLPGPAQALLVEPAGDALDGALLMARQHYRGLAP